MSYLQLSANRYASGAMPTPNNAGDHIDWKLHAAQRALLLVESGMTLGLGSGSTATLWIKLLGEQVRDHGLQIRAIASSEDSERLGRSCGIPLSLSKSAELSILQSMERTKLHQASHLSRVEAANCCAKRLSRAHPNVSWWWPTNRNKSKSSADSLYLLK